MNNAIYLVLILLLIVITIISPDFLKVNNFRLILTQASTRIIIALGVGGVLITQGTDLSAGRIVPTFRTTELYYDRLQDNIYLIYV